MKTKFSLSKSEQSACFANAARLTSAGVAIGLENIAPSESPSPGLRIEQSGPGEICAGTLGGMALAIYVCLRVLKSGFMVYDYKITLPGCNADISLVELEDDSRGYWPLGGWLHYERSTVLNRLIQGDRPLPLGKKLDGFLIAESFDPLPSHLRSGMPIIVKVCLADQWGNFVESDVPLAVEWREQPRGRREKRPAATGHHSGFPSTHRTVANSSRNPSYS